MSAAFPYSEARLAGVLGVSRGRVRYLRSQHLEENRDWQKNGADILLSKVGLDRICNFEECTLTGPKLDECLAQKNGAKPAVEKKKMTVVPPRPMNPRMLRVKEDSGLVDVGKNATFVFGDVIEVVPHPSFKDTWMLVSPVPRDRRRVPL